MHTSDTEQIKSRDDGMLQFFPRPVQRILFFCHLVHIELAVIFVLIPWSFDHSIERSEHRSGASDSSI